MSCANQVDPDITSILSLVAYPIGPEVDALEEPGMDRIRDQPRGNQLLQHHALVALDQGVAPVCVGIGKVVQYIHG